MTHTHETPRGESSGVIMALIGLLNAPPARRRNSAATIALFEDNTPSAT